MTTTKRIQTFANCCLEELLVFGGLKSLVLNGSGNAHVRCRWNRIYDRDAGDGLVTLSASRSTALHYKPKPGIQRRKEKEDDRETRIAAILKQT